MIDYFYTIIFYIICRCFCQSLEEGQFYRVDRQGGLQALQAGEGDHQKEVRE